MDESGHHYKENVISLNRGGGGGGVAETQAALHILILGSALNDKHNCWLLGNQKIVPCTVRHKY